MVGMRKLLVLTLLFSVNLVAAQQCDFNITSLPYTINQNNKYYCLNSSLQINGSTAVTFSATIQNSTLDCQGFALDGNDASSTNGVSFQSTNQKNTVKNCVITNFQNGVYTYKGGNNTFTNNTVNSDLYGFYLYESSDNKLDGNVVSFNEDYGINLFYSSKRNNITNNNVSYNGLIGIILASSSNSNNIANNIANYNNDGIGVSGWGNNLTNNTANYNTLNNGIGVQGDGSHTLKYNTANYNMYGIRISNCNNNNLISNTVSYNSWKGIFIDLSSYNVLDNNTILKVGNQTGLHVKTSPSGNTPQHAHDIDETNTVNGLPVKYYDGTYKTCPDNQVLEFGQSAAHLEFYDCENVTVKNSNFTNVDGVYLTLTKDSRIENVVSSYNDYGISLISSWNNIITNCTTDFDNSGIYLYSSDDNTVYSNFLVSNIWYGLDARLSTNYTVHNNYFANANNTNIYSSQGAWNTTKSLHPNIVGGEYLSGNYWNSFSSECYDSEPDGICDAVYQLDDNNADYLPLTLKPDGQNCTDDSECSSNVCCHEVCRLSCPFCGDGFCDSSESCESDSSTCQSGYACTNGCVLIGDGDNHGPPPIVIPTCHARGGVICAVNETCPGKWLNTSNDERCCSVVCAPPKKKLPVNVSAQLEADIGNISANDSKTVDFSESGGDVHLKEINISVKKIVNSVRINIQKLVGKPREIVEEPSNRSGAVYSYLNISVENVEEDDIDTVRIVFRVNKSWILSNGLDEDKIFLNRFVNNELVKLPTKKVSEDSVCGCIYYEAESSGFSYFVITGEKELDEIVEESEDVSESVSFCGDFFCNTDENCSSCRVDCGDCPVVVGDDFSVQYLLIIVFVFVVLFAAYVTRPYKVKR